MQTVADAAKVSRSAVSLALRSHPSIPERTRQHVMAVAERLGYRVNPMVAALMSLQRQHRPPSPGDQVIAYLTTHPDGNSWRAVPPYVAMHAGAVARAAELGYKVEEFNLRAPGMTAGRLAQILHSRHIHAAIVAPLSGQQVEINFDFSRLAVVGLGMSVHRPIITRVANDHFQSAALAVAECVAHGYRRIGMVISHETSRRLDHRYVGGFRFAIEHHRLKPLPILMREHTADLAPEMPGWIRQHRPDVVILDNANSEQHGLVPTAVGIASLTTDAAHRHVSGILQNHEVLGNVAVDHVVSKLQTNRFGPVEHAHLHLVAGTWMEGESTPGPRRGRVAAANRSG